MSTSHGHFSWVLPNFDSCCFAVYLNCKIKEAFGIANKVWWELKLEFFLHISHWKGEVFYVCGNESKWRGTHKYIDCRCHKKSWLQWLKNESICGGTWSCLDINRKNFNDAEICSCNESSSNVLCALCLIKFNFDEILFIWNIKK